MIKFLVPVLVTFPLLGAVGTEAAIAATNDPLGVLGSQVRWPPSTGQETG